MTIDSAILQLTEQIESYPHGTSQQPRHGTDAWYMLRALDIGRCYLLRLKQLELHGDEAACERLYTQCSKLSKSARLPAEQPGEVVG